MQVPVLHQGESVIVQLEGSCLCNRVRFVLTGDPSGFFLCHCSHCRKGTGSAHAASLFLSGGCLHWLSGEEQITRYTLPGSRHSRSFCSICGSPVPLALPGQDVIQVPAGALDSEPGLVPDGHIFVASGAVWENGLELLPRFPGLPDGDGDSGERGRTT